MQKHLLLLMAFVCSNVWGAPQPKALGTSLPGSVSAIQPVESTPDSAGSYRLPRLNAENVFGHSITEDGSTLLLLRFSRPGAAAMRLHLEDIHLPEGASLFIYSLDNAGQLTAQTNAVGNHSDYWSPSLRGDTVYVEVDWQNEVPGDIPFRVTELRESDPAEETPVRVTGETRKGSYRGRDLTWTVIDGLAITEGDIILGAADEIEATSGKESARRDGVAITGATYRWAGGIVPYYLPPGFPSPERITTAINHWNTYLAGVIRLVPRTNERNYITFIASGGCAAMVGMSAIGAQPVYLPESCGAGNAIHEIGHAIGLWHEQSREDRDSYVRVLWDNIALASAFNFNQNIWNGDDVGAYDFNSIMHYGPYAFSANGKATMETIPAGIPIGQRNGLSTGDIAAVRAIYGAPPLVDRDPPTPEPTIPVPPIPVPQKTETVNVSVQTNPTGQPIRVDGVAYTAPVPLVWNVGSTHTIEAVTPLNGSTVMQFVRWSDGGLQTHSVVAAPTMTMLKADYSISYRVTASAQPSYAGTVEVSPDSPTDLYPANTALTLTAVPNAGYCFSSWNGLLSRTPFSTTLTVTDPLNLSAQFVPGSVSINSQLRFSPAAGENVSIPVSSSGGACGWTATSYASWLTFASGARGVGSGNVVLTVAPNTSGLARAGVILIGGRGFVVSQSPH